MNQRRNGRGSNSTDSPYSPEGFPEVYESSNERRNRYPSHAMQRNGRRPPEQAVAQSYGFFGAFPAGNSGPPQLDDGRGVEERGQVGSPPLAVVEGELLHGAGPHNYRHRVDQGLGHATSAFSTDGASLMAVPIEDLPWSTHALRGPRRGEPSAGIQNIMEMLPTSGDNIATEYNGGSFNVFEEDVDQLVTSNFSSAHNESYQSDVTVRPGDRNSSSIFVDGANPGMTNTALSEGGGNFLSDPLSNLDNSSTSSRVLLQPSSNSYSRHDSRDVSESNQFSDIASYDDRHRFASDFASEPTHHPGYYNIPWARVDASNEQGGFSYGIQDRPDGGHGIAPGARFGDVQTPDLSEYLEENFIRDIPLSTTSLDSTPSETFKCELCGAVCRGKYGSGNLGRHKRTKHGGSGGTSRQFKCGFPSCKKHFQRTDARLKHERKVHLQELGDNPSQPRGTTGPTRR